MFKFVVLLAVAAVVAAKPGLLSTHSVVQPVVVGATIHSAPSAISHQSQTQYHSKTVVTPVLAPVVKSYVAAPIVHVAPVVHAAPVLHAGSVAHAVPVVSHVHPALPVLSSVHALPAVHSAHVLHAAPVVHSVHGVHGSLHH